MNIYAEPVTMGEWVLTFLILCIPCLNIITMFVWAFSSSTKKSKANFFKAYLVVCVISIVLSIVFSIIIMLVSGASMAAILEEAARQSTSYPTY